MKHSFLSYPAIDDVAEFGICFQYSVFFQVVNRKLVDLFVNSEDIMSFFSFVIAPNNEIFQFNHQQLMIDVTGSFLGQYLKYSNLLKFSF